jgi:hypothetical protein
MADTNRIDFEDFVAATLSAVARAQAAQGASSNEGATSAALVSPQPSPWFRRPILIGIIMDPDVLSARASDEA